MSSKRDGQCLCGAVSYSADIAEGHVHVCHCNMCQKWHGGPGLSIKVDACDIKGEEKVTWYRSSEWAQRGFCSACGTHLFGKTDDGSYYGVYVGSMDDQEGLSIESHIFIDKKPPHYDFTGDAPRMTEEEFLKMVGAIE